MRFELNKNNGIILIVVSAFLFIFMLISIDWNDNLSFTRNITTGYFYKIEYSCDQYSSYCQKFRFYLRYMILFPMTTSVFGLYLFLNKK